MPKSLINGGPCRDRTYDQLIKRDLVEGIRRGISRVCAMPSLSILANGARFVGVCYRRLEEFTHKEVLPMAKPAILVLAAALTASGCRACREHPVVCVAAGVIVVGAGAVILSHHHHDQGALNPCGPGRMIHPEAPYYGDCH